MGNPAVKGFSISFFISAALLALFGFAAMNNHQPNAIPQLVLAVVMGGAGIYLMQGTAEARLVALGAAGVTIAYGAFELVTGRGYIPGTIIAIFVVARLAGASALFGTAGGQRALPPCPAPPVTYAPPQAAYPQDPFGPPPTAADPRFG